MASNSLFRPLPLRERGGRVVAPVSSALRIRRLAVPSPPHPNPLPRGEREPEVPSAMSVIANSTVLALALVPANATQEEQLEAIRRIYHDGEQHMQRWVQDERTNREPGGG